MSAIKYPYPYEAHHPKVRRVKILFNQHFIEELLPLFYYLSVDIDNQRKESGSPIVAMQVLHNRILTYMEISCPYIYYLPRNLSDAELMQIFNREQDIIRYKDLITEYKKGPLPSGIVQFIMVCPVPSYPSPLE